MNNLSVLPIVGLPQFDGWSQVVEHREDQSFFVCSFAVSGQHAGNIGRDLVAILEQNPPTKPRAFYSSLEAMAAHAKYNQAILFLAAGLFEAGSSLLAAQAGSIFLKRGEKQGMVIESRAELRVVEGTHQPDDIFVLLTESAREYLPEMRLKFEQGYDAQTTATSIVPSIHRSESAATAALAVIYKSDEDEGESHEFSSWSDRSETQTTKLADELVTDKPRVNQADDLDTWPKQAGVSTPLSLRTGRTDVKRTNRLFNGTRMLAGGVFRLIKKVLWLVWRLLKTLGRVVVGQIPRLGNRKMRWKLQTTKFGRRQLIAWAILLMILTGIIWSFWSSQRTKRIRRETLSSLAPITAQLEQARELANQNPVEARAQVEAIQNQLQAMEVAATHPAAKQLITDAIRKTAALSDDISGLEEISALPQFYDLRLARSDFVATSSTTDGEKVVFLDQERKQLLVLNLDTKAVEQIDVDANLNSTNVLLIDDDIFVLADGVYKLSNQDGSIVWTNEIVDDDNISGSKMLKNFGESLYVLNPVLRNVFRFSPGDGGYKQSVAWLKSPLGMPFDQVTSMAIDGDMWLTGSGGEIKRFNSGLEKPFEILGMAETFSSPLKLVTDENLSSLYILEAGKSRIVIVGKDGQFLREIDSSSLGAATDILVSEKLQKIFAISGSILYQIDL